MTKRDEVLEFLVQFGRENTQAIQILSNQLDQKGLAVFGSFCWHLIKNCKTKDLKINEFLTLLAEINING